MSQETNDATKPETPGEPTDKLTGFREVWRELFAPTAARLALLAVVRQFQNEGATREHFLNQCGEAWDNTATEPASVPADEGENTTT